MDKADNAMRFVWAARILAIAYAVFLLLFSFDVFEGGGSFWDKLLGFAMHSLPTVAIALLLTISWKRPDYGAISFFLLAVLFTLTFRTYDYPSTFLFLSVPIVLIGALFLVAYLLGRKRGA